MRPLQIKTSFLHSPEFQSDEVLCFIYFFNGTEDVECGGKLINQKQLKKVHISIFVVAVLYKFCRLPKSLSSSVSAVSFASFNRWKLLFGLFLFYKQTTSSVFRQMIPHRPLRTQLPSKLTTPALRSKDQLLRLTHQLFSQQSGHTNWNQNGSCGIFSAKI